MSTMPEVAVGWLRSLLRTLGGNLGRDILNLGVAGLDTPIWDVLAPEGKQEEVGGRLRMGSRSPASQLGKRYQTACSGSGSLLGSLGLNFHSKKNV
jgi:hypothetical protein